MLYATTGQAAELRDRRINQTNYNENNMELSVHQSTAIHALPSALSVTAVAESSDRNGEWSKQAPPWVSMWDSTVELNLQPSLVSCFVDHSQLHIPSPIFLCNFTSTTLRTCRLADGVHQLPRVTLRQRVSVGFMFGQLPIRPARAARL